MRRRSRAQQTSGQGHGNGLAADGSDLAGRKPKSSNSLLRANIQAESIGGRCGVGTLWSVFTASRRCAELIVIAIPGPIADAAAVSMPDALPCSSGFCEVGCPTELPLNSEIRFDGVGAEAKLIRVISVTGAC